MTQFRVLLDMDSTVYDLTTPWLQWYNSHPENWQPKLRPLDIVSWQWESFIDARCGTSIYDFLELEGMFHQLRPYPHAVDAINEVHELGVDQVFASACSTKYGPYEKMCAINRDFPDIGKRGTIITGGRKDLIQGDLLVDDGPHNLDAFKRAGGLTCRADMHNAPYCQRDNRPDFILTDWRLYPDIVKEAAAKAGVYL